MAPLSSSSSSSVLVPLALLMIAVAPAACTSVELGERSTGERGTLAFEYTSLDCLFGCALDKPALLGSTVSIQVSQLDPSKTYVARLGENGFGSITTQSQSCSCTSSSGGTTTSHSVGAGEPCSGGEIRACTLSVSLSAKTETDGMLEISSEAGLEDRIVVKARRAKQLNVTARIGESTVELNQGVLVVPVGKRIAFDVRASDGTNPLVIGTGGITLESDDRQVVQADSSFGSVLGARAVKVGETVVTIQSGGNGNSLSTGLRVVE